MWETYTTLIRLSVSAKLSSDVSISRSCDTLPSPKSSNIPNVRDISRSMPDTLRNCPGIAAPVPRNRTRGYTHRCVGWRAGGVWSCSWRHFASRSATTGVSRRDSRFFEKVGFAFLRQEESSAPTRTGGESVTFISGATATSPCSSPSPSSSCRLFPPTSSPDDAPLITASPLPTSPLGCSCSSTAMAAGPPPLEGPLCVHGGKSEGSAFARTALSDADEGKKDSSDEAVSPRLQKRCRTLSCEREARQRMRAS
mmetsp:Transcript_30218/g.87821  ORF Transcript_30218/g.87821 Transcript_30218/m.87821 type:complete len:254 (-) Transcript_30218:992-1753(-)